MKVQLLVLLLIASILAQDYLLQSDSLTTQVISQLQEKTTLTKTAVPDAASSGDASAVLTDPVGNGWKWVYPETTSKILPVGWTVTYHSDLYTDCPQNAAVLYIGASSSFTVYLNGLAIYSGNGWKPITKLDLKLICGCNNLTVVVRNRFPSTGGVIFAVKQNKTGCYQCDNLGVTFYNRDTCQCECVSQCGCSNAAQSWNGYPTCACKCPDFKNCLKAQFYNRQSCNCECNKICCAKGYYQDAYTCKCLKYNCSPGFVPCNSGYYWDYNKCDCLPIPNPDCTITADQVRCIENTVFSSVTCQCEPLHPYDPILTINNCPNAKPCGNFETLNPYTCTCVSKFNTKLVANP